MPVHCFDPLNIQACRIKRTVMAFRDLLAGAHVHDAQISVKHGVLDASYSNGHLPTLFTNIAECPGHRTAANVLVRERLCEAFSIGPGELIDILAWAMDHPEDPVEVERSTAEVLQNRQKEVNLEAIPIPWQHRADRGRYQSASIIIAQHNGIRNASFHRQFLRTPTTTVSRFVPRHLKTMVDSAQSEGDNVSICVVNAPDPTVLLAAAMSFKDHIDELCVAAALHRRIYGKPLRVVTMDNGIQVPADAEYAMEASITSERSAEGPYVDITGTLDDVRQESVIEYKSIHHRDDAVFHALIPAEREHRTLMGLPRAPTIKKAVSEVVECTDVHLTDGGSGWLAAVVQIVPKSPDDGKRAIEAAIQGHGSMKQVIVVDTDIDIADPVRVNWALMTRWQPDRDTIILSNQKGSSLDPSRYEDGRTSKIGMDATIKSGQDDSAFRSAV